ncbi:VOC family protein [Arthrobacter sp. YAF17]
MIGKLREDLDGGEAAVLRAGATSLDAGTEAFRVFTDPSGHPFCLVLS